MFIILINFILIIIIIVVVIIIIITIITITITITIAITITITITIPMTLSPSHSYHLITDGLLLSMHHQRFPTTFNINATVALSRHLLHKAPPSYAYRNSLLLFDLDTQFTSLFVTVRLLDPSVRQSICLYVSSSQAQLYIEKLVLT